MLPLPNLFKIFSIGSTSEISIGPLNFFSLKSIKSLFKGPKLINVWNAACLEKKIQILMGESKSSKLFDGEEKGDIVHGIINLFWSIANKKYALVTMCIGVGQGYATVIERV